MNLRDDLRHGVRIGRAEFRRSVRGYTRDARRLVGLAVAVLFFGGYLLVSLPTAYVVGRTVGTVAAVPYLGPAGLLLPAGVLLLAALRTMERLGGVDADALLLTTVHPRAVVVGLVLAEVGRLTLWFGVPIVAVATAFALGLGAPTLPVTAGLVLLPPLVCAAVWGYALGITGLRILRRLPTLRRLLKAGGIVALAAVVVLSQVVARSLVAGTLSLTAVRDALTVTPLTDYLALAFVTTPLGNEVSPAVAAVLAGWLASTPVGLTVAARSASTLWFGDGAASDPPGRSAATAGGQGFAPPRPFAWVPAGRIAWGHLLRAVRHPQELSHLLVLLFVAGPALGSTVSGADGGGTAILVAGAGAGVGIYLAGATFGLNPLGDDRPQLPLVLLTETPPRTVLRGRAAAGLAVGLPVATLFPVGSIAAGAPVAVGLGFAAVGAGLSVVAAGFALGLGCAYPIYETRELWGAETVAPSTLVLVGYSLVAAGGTVTWLLLAWVWLAGGLDPTAAYLGGVAILTLLTGGVSVLSYRYAKRRYRRYTL